MTTVVTAFYEIPSKFTPDRYWNWIKNFCEIDCNLVLFTSPNLVERFLKLKSSKTVIIPLQFEKLHHYKFINLYKLHHNLDHHKSIHSPELYIIWAEKVKFVMRAIELNPFNSQKFVWCDIGVVREPQFLNIFKNFPKGEKIVENKMNFLLLNPFTNEDKIETNNIKGPIYGSIRMGGGIHAADIETWKKYDNLWDSTLRRYFEANRFAGQDQMIMATICLENEYLFHLITPKDYGGDPWFYLLYYWSV